MRILKVVAFVLVIAGMTACTKTSDDPSHSFTSDITSLAQEYVFLELAMGVHDDKHVDAYVGPPEIRIEAEASGLSLDDIATAAGELVMKIQSIEVDGDSALASRVDGLIARLQSLDTRIRINNSEPLKFDDEVRLLFGTTLAQQSLGDFDAALEEIDALLPGDRALSDRVDTYLNEFNIPADKLAAVMDASIAECRRRSAEFIAVPEGESFTVEYVTDQPWSGYNWFLGDSKSLIQVNTDFPSRIDAGVTLGCHEGYPGHHLYKTLLEENMVKQEGWIEFTIDPLFSPVSLIAEGSAEYGISLAFSKDERIQFETEVLFPIAGLDPATADSYYELKELQSELAFARNSIARAYLDGESSRDDAIAGLAKYGLISSERAANSLNFIDGYRSYVINYNHGLKLVREYVERDTASPAERWQKFEAMLSTPMLPDDLL
jgi:hypothetical protein